MSAADATPPFLSLITPCLNARGYIAEMLASVRAQSGVAFEHIVLDAGSTDGTRELLASCRDIRLVAEPDAGSHDAMNKGIRLARGEVIAFINTDDLYAPGILAAVAERFAAEPALEALLGRSYLFAEEAGSWRVTATYPLGRRDGFDLAELMYGIPCINARFFRRRVFERAGVFDNDFSFAADRHFLLRLALLRPRGAVLHRPAYFYRRHGASRTLDSAQRNAAALDREHVAIADALLATPQEPRDRRALEAWRAYERARGALRGAGPAAALIGAMRAGEAAALLHGLAAKLAVIGHRRTAAVVPYPSVYPLPPPIAR
jgi:glycosyltransferase involved in cell wall biosynthesis